MSHSHPELYLHEQAMLLALRDTTGTIASRAGNYPCALGGAILAELMLSERLRVGDDEGRFIVVNDDRPVDDALLNEALELVAADKTRRPAVEWAHRFAGIKDLKDKVARELCDRGILSASDEKSLLFFTRKVYPEVDHEPEQRVIDELRGAIFSERKSMDPRIAILLSLTRASGILKVHFEEDDLVRRAERIEEIVNGSLLEGAPRPVIDAAEMARQLAAANSARSAAAAGGA